MLEFARARGNITLSKSCRKIQLVKAHSFCDWQKEETADEIRMTKQQSCNGNLKN